MSTQTPLSGASPSLDPVRNPANSDLLGRFARWRVRRWARRMIAQGAVVLDTETTDLFGRVVEIAVVTADGEILLDSLVDPQEPISAAATAVHGLSDADVAGAPPFARLAGQLHAVLAGRPVLAYNAPYDEAVVRAELQRLSAPAAALLGQRPWGCLMRARAAYDQDAWVRLDGSHRAAGDAAAAARVLRELAGLPLARGYSADYSVGPSVQPCGGASAGP